MTTRRGFLKNLISIPIAAMASSCGLATPVASATPTRVKHANGLYLRGWKLIQVPPGVAIESFHVVDLTT